MFYGILDVCIMITFIVLAIIYWKDFSRRTFLFCMLLQFPAIVLFIVQLSCKNLMTMGFYKNWLLLRLVTQGFIIPLILVRNIDEFLAETVCTSITSVDSATFNQYLNTYILDESTGQNTPARILVQALTMLSSLPQQYDRCLDSNGNHIENCPLLVSAMCYASVTIVIFVGFLLL